MQIVEVVVDVVEVVVVVVDVAGDVVVVVDVAGVVVVELVELVVSQGRQQQVSSDGPPIQYKSPPDSWTSPFPMHWASFCRQVPVEYPPRDIQCDEHDDCPGPPPQQSSTVTFIVKPVISTKPSLSSEIDVRRYEPFSSGHHEIFQVELKIEALYSTPPIQTDT